MAAEVAQRRTLPRRQAETTGGLGCRSRLPGGEHEALPADSPKKAAKLLQRRHSSAERARPCSRDGLGGARPSWAAAGMRADLRPLQLRLHPCQQRPVAPAGAEPKARRRRKSAADGQAPGWAPGRR
mmetsp:Transcript_154273/g.494746  ORF Transcript_154273/g.494746 Transcript_154273/m.494746 type:complete len:127 (+) Transcript_154273:650-1030(+)